MQIDTQVANKKQQQLLKQLHKDIVLNRQKLDNAFRGDKQQIRNVLQEHRNMQLAYQELHALVIQTLYILSAPLRHLYICSFIFQYTTAY